MNTFFIFVVGTWLLQGISVTACPTAIEKFESTTPPLFSKDYEKKYTLASEESLEIQEKKESQS